MYLVKVYITVYSYIINLSKCTYHFVGMSSSTFGDTECEISKRPEDGENVTSTTCGFEYRVLNVLLYVSVVFDEAQTLQTLELVIRLLLSCISCDFVQSVNRG